MVVAEPGAWINQINHSTLHTWHLNLNCAALLVHKNEQPRGVTLTAYVGLCKQPMGSFCVDHLCTQSTLVLPAKMVEQKRQCPISSIGSLSRPIHQAYAWVLCIKL